MLKNVKQYFKNCCYCDFLTIKILKILVKLLSFKNSSTVQNFENFVLNDIFENSV